MSLPDVTMTVQDGALGIAPPLPTNAQVKLGVSTLGTVNTLYAFGDAGTLSSTLEAGPMVEAAARVLSDAGGPVYCMPVNPSQAGYTGTVTQAGTGTGTVSASLAPHKSVLITITTAGAINTMAFTWKVGTGATSAPVVTSGGGTYTFLVPGTFTTLSFAPGTYVLSSTYTIATDGTITRGGSAINTVTQASSALDSYSVVVTITTAGALGAGAFKYSVDGGNTQSGAITIPSGGTYAIPSTGVVLTFSGTFVATDTYSFYATPPGYTTSDVTAAVTALLLLTTQWFMVHLVGTPASASAAATMASTLDTLMTSAETGYRFGFAMMDTPTTGSIITSGSAAIADTADTDSTVSAAFTSFTSKRVAVCAGDEDLVSVLTGRIHRRNASWATAARASLVPPSEHLGRVGRGALPGVVKLYRDEQATPLLDAARFVTHRTIVGIAGFYVTRGLTMALATSDFHTIQNRRVLDLACVVARQGLLTYVNASVRVSKSTGYILEQDAKSIEADVGSRMQAALVNTTPPYASGASIVLSRTQNILSTATEPVTVRVIPVGYLESLQVNIGFQNPAIQ